MQKMQVCHKQILLLLCITTHFFLNTFASLQTAEQYADSLMIFSHQRVCLLIHELKVHFIVIPLTYFPQIVKM